MLITMTHSGWTHDDSHLFIVISTDIFLIFVGRDKLLLPFLPQIPPPPHSVWSITSPSWIPQISCHSDIAAEAPEAWSSSGALAFLPCCCQSATHTNTDAWVQWIHHGVYRAAHTVKRVDKGCFMNSNVYSLSVQRVKGLLWFEPNLWEWKIKANSQITFWWSDVNIVQLFGQ